MKTLILTLISVSLVNNVVLSQFLGLCPFLGVSKQTKTALSMGGAVIFVITIASAVTNLLYRLLVLFHVEYLETVSFILIIAALVQLVELFLKKYSKPLYNSLGVYLPLITTNCAVLGVALTNVQNNYDFITSVVAGFGTALGFTISITILAGIRERIADNDSSCHARIAHRFNYRWFNGDCFYWFFRTYLRRIFYEYCINCHTCCRKYWPYRGCFSIFSE